MIRNICETLSKGQIKTLEKMFNGYGININLSKEVSKMKIISNEALKDVCRNGSLFFL